MSENRAILLTPSGAGAIAVVRLSGENVGGFLRDHFSKKVSVPGRCVHGELRDGGRVLDDPVVVAGPDGAWADVNVHGGGWVITSVIDLAARRGFEIVERADGPLLAEAVDADEPIEREVLRFLPLARTELALRVLLAQPAAWRGIDAYGPAEVLADAALHWLLHPPRVAIVGVPNVGKSTLANQLFGQTRSITADLPGTTRDWVGELANLDGLAVTLVDTPGLRDTPDPIESAAIERAAAVVAGADLVVLVLDVTMPLATGQAELLSRHPEAVRVINKVDARPAWDAAAAGGIQLAAKAGQGVDALRAAIRRRFGCEGIEVNRPRCWTARQRKALGATDESVPSRPRSP
jgi:tRNA modification GTPase